MTEILMKLIRGETITDQNLAGALYEICDNEHAHCNNNCPVYEANGGEAPGSDKPFDENRGCDTFKRGDLMLAFLRKKDDEKFMADVEEVTKSSLMREAAGKLGIPVIEIKLAGKPSAADISGLPRKMKVS